jgi:hypothetical protein
MFPAFMNRLTKKIGLLLFGLTTVSLLWYLGCAPATFEISSGVQSGVDDVQYLSAYGEWEDIQPYGMAWRPDVVPDWEPFYYGNWVWTTDGWTWVSYEPYGWLVYHYGYWDYQPDIGWFWVPGDTWSPAQVQWYTFGDYTAWAPLPPPNVYWPEPWVPYQTNIWIVVDDYRFTSQNVGRHRIKELPNRDVIERGRVATGPPDVHRVEILEKRTIPAVKIRRQSINIRRQAIPAPPEQVRQPGVNQPPQQVQQPKEVQPPQQVRQPGEIKPPQQVRQPEESPQSKEVQQPKEVQRPKEPQLERMVLPDGENRKVRKYTEQVERQVLVPKKSAPAPQPPQQEKKTDTEEKRKTRSK